MVSGNNDSLIKNIIRFIYHRRKFFLYLTILILILAYAVFGKKGFLQRYDLEVENKELKEKLKNEQEKSLILQKEIDELKTSEQKLEKVAREKYGMVKPGEEIYKVQIDSAK